MDQSICAHFPTPTIIAGMKWLQHIESTGAIYYIHHCDTINSLQSPPYNSEPMTIVHTTRHGLARYSFFCFRSKRVDRCVGVEHEEYLEAVDLTSCVGTIPTWLASYFLV